MKTIFHFLKKFHKISKSQQTNTSGTQSPKPRFSNDNYSVITLTVFEQSLSSQSHHWGLVVFQR